ncbi:MAG: PhoH family protein [Spirochaetia bacterium]|jgi:PhoH-like ATPase|nr:PhoH family protein [Spirochaetia bacterium]
MTGVKTFVIDTNVLIHRPDALLSFRDSEIVVPLWVLEELDKLKAYSDERGRNARHAIRFLDDALRRGRPKEGVRLDNGSVLSVALMYAKNPGIDFSSDSPDDKIILTAYDLQKKGKTVFFVSKDINARVKASSIGIRAVDYEKQKVPLDKLYSGYFEAEIPSGAFEALRGSGVLSPRDEPALQPQWGNQLFPNEFAVLRGRGEEAPLLASWKQEKKEFRLARRGEGAVAGVRALNIQQRMAFEHLLDPEVELVTLVGKAGTGKTLLAIAAGLCMVIDDQQYSRVLVSRPVVPLGKDIGFLPGPKDEKLFHWMQPLFDNLDYILSVYKKPTLKTVDQLMASKHIELEAIAHIRGRSLPGQYIIIDEAQNLTPHEIKTIVSRAGQGTKVVLTGDPYQIDSPYLDANSNGLSYLVEVFKGQEIFGHVTMQKSERSRLAELAAELL